MTKLNLSSKKELKAGFKLKNNGIFSIGLGAAMFSSLINDICDIAANNILEAKGLSASYDLKTPFMKIGSNANNSSVLI